MRWSEFEREADVHVQKQKVINETMLPERPALNDFKEKFNWCRFLWGLEVEYGQTELINL